MFGVSVSGPASPMNQAPIIAQPVPKRLASPVASLEELSNTTSPQSPIVGSDLDAALEDFLAKLNNPQAEPASPVSEVSEISTPVSPAQIPLPPSPMASRPASPTQAAPEEGDETKETTVSTPATPATSAEQAKLQPLTNYGNGICTLIGARRYRKIRDSVNTEFELGMAKVRTDLERLKLRKEAIVKGTSSPDVIEEDLMYLTEITGDAEQVLQAKYDERRAQLDKMIKIFINRRMAKYTPAMMNTAAVVIDRLAHDPIAESKKIFRTQKKFINDQMSV